MRMDRAKDQNTKKQMIIIEDLTPKYRITISKKKTKTEIYQTEKNPITPSKNSTTLHLIK